MTVKERILQSSMQLFLSHGYKGVSISDIITAADVSKGGLYNYFSSKEDLFLQVLMQSSTAFVDTQITSFAKQKFDSFQAFYLAFAKVYDQLLADEKSDLGATLILMVDAVKTFPQLGQENKRYDDFFDNTWIANLKQGQLSGELRPDFSAESLVKIYLNLVHGVCVDFALRSPNTDISKIQLKEKFNAMYLLIKKRSDNGIS